MTPARTPGLEAPPAAVADRLAPRTRRQHLHPAAADLARISRVIDRDDHPASLRPRRHLTKRAPAGDSHLIATGRPRSCTSPTSVVPPTPRQGYACPEFPARPPAEARVDLRAVQAADAIAVNAPRHKPRWRGLRRNDPPLRLRSRSVCRAARARDIAIVGAGDIALGDLLRCPYDGSWSREDQASGGGAPAAAHRQTRAMGRRRPQRVVIPPRLVAAGRARRDNRAAMPRLATLLPSSSCGGACARRPTVSSTGPDGARVIAAADRYLKRPRSHTPARRPGSRGPHDFFSEGLLLPDPKNPDGPYIQKT